MVIHPSLIWVRSTWTYLKSEEEISSSTFSLLRIENGLPWIDLSLPWFSICSYHGACCLCYCLSRTSFLFRACPYFDILCFAETWTCFQDGCRVEGWGSSAACFSILFSSLNFPFGYHFMFLFSGSQYFVICPHLLDTAHGLGNQSYFTACRITSSRTLIFTCDITYSD